MSDIDAAVERLMTTVKLTPALIRHEMLRIRREALEDGKCIACHRDSDDWQTTDMLEKIENDFDEAIRALKEQA